MDKVVRLSNEEWADALKTYDETLKVTLKEKFRMMLFGALMQNNIGWWNQIRFSTFELMDKLGSGQAQQDIPDQNWKGWEKVAKKAGLIIRFQEWRGKKEPFPWGVLSLFIEEKISSVSKCPGKDIPMSAFFEDEEEEEEIPQDQDTDSEGAGWCGVIPLENIPISIVGKAPKKRRKGKQEVAYKVDFEGFDEEEQDWFPAALLRKKHPQGAAAIREFEEQEKQARFEEKERKEQETTKMVLKMLEEKGEGNQKAKKKGAKKKGALAEAMHLLRQDTTTDEEDDDDDDTDSDTYQSQLEFEPEPRRRQRGRKGRAQKVKVKEEETNGLNFFQSLDAQVNKSQSIPEPKQREERKRVKKEGAATRTASRKSKHDARDESVPSTSQGSRSKYRGVEIEGISSSNDHLMITLKWPDGSSKEITHEEAHEIPELAKKLLDEYAKRILGFKLLRHLL